MNVSSPVKSSARPTDSNSCRLQGHEYFRLSGLSRYLMLLVMPWLLPIPAHADLDLEAAVGQWLEVRQWVDELTVPDTSPLVPELSEASAVCVILRNRGRVVGFGLAHAEESSESGGSLTWNAAKEAINLAKKDDVISSLPESVQQDAGKQLTLQIETAGPLQALMGRTFQSATERLRPGIDGLAMRHDDRWWFQFPAQLRITNAFVGPKRLYSLALSSDLSPRQIESLRDQGNISLYAFETIDLAQARPDALPMMLISGDLEVVQSDVTAERILKARDDLARHLLSRVFKTDQGYRLIGSFTPMTSSFDQKFARHHERYLVALALAQYAKSPGVDAELSKQSREVAIGLLENFSEPARKSDQDPMNAAAWCLAAAQLELDVDSERRDSLIAFLELMQESDDVDIRKNAHDLMFTAAALSACSPEHREQAMMIARRTHGALPEHHQVTLLPWLSWIERDNRDHAESDDDLTALRQLRNRMLELQIEASQNPAHKMNAGGFLLKPGVDGVTSQSVRPAIFLLESRHDPAYWDPDLQEEIDRRSDLFLRYLLQLSCREDVAGIWRQPERIQGGIRHSTWDARMDAVAQAMALIALNAASSR